MIKRTAILFLFWFALAVPIFSQAPPPPPDGAKGSTGNKAPGGGAPVDAGLVTMILMVAGYGGFKWLDTRKQDDRR